MKRRARIAFALFAALAAGCTPPPKPPTPDAGDPSCGVDCASQNLYGLVARRCFEYSASATAANPPDLGVYVSDTHFVLEGDIPTVEVKYLVSGQIKMSDYFSFPNGDLYLMRRSWPQGSVTYKDAAGNIVGVPWARVDTAAGQNFTTTATADVNLTARVSESTTYRVTAEAPSASEQNVPNGKYPDAVKLQFKETPDHGADTRRVLQRSLGFVLFASTFSPPPGGTAQPYVLQNVRDIGSPDGGGPTCGLP